MITPMVKVTLMGPKRLLMAAFDLVHSAGVVHLDPYPISGAQLTFLEAVTEKGEERTIRDQLNGLLDKVVRLKGSLPPPPAPSTAPAWLFGHSISRGDIVDLLDRAEAEITPEHENLLALRAELAVLSRYERVVTALYPLLEEVVEQEKLELMGIILERKREGVLPLLEKEMDRITGRRYRIFTGHMDRDHIAAILAYPRQSEGPVKALFSAENIAEIRLPEEYSDRPLAATLRMIIRRQKELPHELELSEKLLGSLSGKWLGSLARIEEIIRDRLDEIQTVGFGAQSRHTFFLRGWMPEDRTENLVSTLKGNFGDEILVQIEPIQESEYGQVPVELKNRPYVRIFEPIVRLVSLPRYGSLDPTPFVAFFFPLFFGFILGDIAYGLVLMALAGLLRRKYHHRPTIRALATVFVFAGFSATIFGVLFGEFLGNLGEHWGLHPLLMDRSQVIMPLLFIALGLGLAHIMVGFILSLITGFRQRHRKQSVAAGANLLALTGLVMVIMSTAGFLPRTANVGVLLLALGIPLLLFTEGFMGPLEFLKALGNVLSYARLMAIGIASVVLANVANMMGGTTESLAAGIMVALIFHTLNFILGVFSPTIHSLRLHYVEFFSKFYQPGGKPYRPFRRHRNL